MKNTDVRFGPFTLITSERLLLCEGEPVRIGSRALAVLMHETAGEGWRM